jgi:hypothetical protein
LTGADGEQTAETVRLAALAAAEADAADEEPVDIHRDRPPIKRKRVPLAATDGTADQFLRFDGLILFLSEKLSVIISSDRFCFPVSAAAKAPEALDRLYGLKRLHIVFDDDSAVFADPTL